MVHPELHTWVIFPTATADLSIAKARREAPALAAQQEHPTHASDGRTIDATLWPAVLQKIKSRVNLFAFGWFESTRLIDEDAATVTIWVPDAWTAD